jgi:hypothetical protein
MQMFFNWLHSRPFEHQGASIVGWSDGGHHMILSIHVIVNANLVGVSYKGYPSCQA